MIRNMFDDPEPKSKKPRKLPKYNTSTRKKDKPVYNGMVFDTKDEMEYYKFLESEVDRQKISLLER